MRPASAFSTTTMSHFINMLKGRANTLPGNNPKGDNRKVGVTWGQTIGRPECPYMKRWVLNFGLGSLRLHHWYQSDDPRHLHDHPWWFLTFVLKGGYQDLSEHKCVGPMMPAAEISKEFLRTDSNGFLFCVLCGYPCTPDGARTVDTLTAPTARWRPALHAHTVQVRPGGCWTVMLTGPHSRDWGFWVDGTWKRMRAYFREHDHHPCED